MHIIVLGGKLYNFKKPQAILICLYILSRYIFTLAMLWLSANHIYRQVTDYRAYKLDITGYASFETSMTSSLLKLRSIELCLTVKPLKWQSALTHALYFIILL